jgi:DNA-binding protein Fis
MKSATTDEFSAVQSLASKLLKQGDADIYRRVIRAVERDMLAHVMEYANGNQIRAAALLGLSRTTLRKRLMECGLPTTSATTGRRYGPIKYPADQ